MADAVDRGLALLERGAFEDALRILGRAARNNRLDADAQHAYGLALHRTWQFPQAVEQFQRADRLKPNRWEVHQNLSAAYHGLEDYDASYAEALRVLELRPGYTHALYHLGDLHQVWGEMPEAVDFYDRALVDDPRNPDIWMGKLFALDLIDGVTPEEALAARRACAAVFEDAARPYRRPHANRPDPDRRLKIGYISGDFRDHTAAYMFGPLYEHHDRDRFMVYSYSSVKHPDSVTEFFRKQSNAWRIINDVDPRAVAECIRDDGIDILIDTGGYTNGGHLPVFAYKPAPLAVQAFGYLTGSGFSTMDAILVDDVLVPPEHESHFVERRLRVPYALGFGGINGNVEIAPKPAGAPLTFGHLGRSDKASRGAVALWSQVLRAYPESRMLLKDRGLRFERTRLRLLHWFAEEGVSPERIDLRGQTTRGEHLATYNEVDVVLDSVPQGGGTTTIEALWMGTPVVTMAGPRIIGRIAATTLHEIGHSEWVADDGAGYVRMAGQAASGGGLGLRGEIASSAVFDGKARTRAFEGVLLDLWREWAARQRMAA